jgi:hypothetical protein
MLEVSAASSREVTMRALALKRVEMEGTSEPKSKTLGDLIAAAFDAAGNDLEAVKQLLGSRAMRRALHARVVLLSSHG